MNEEERTMLADAIRDLTSALVRDVSMNGDELTNIENLVNSLRKEEKNHRDEPLSASNETSKQNELITALKTIRNECKKHEHCDTCPLRNRSKSCSILEQPDKWLLKNESNEDDVVPRIFD